ncbi:hypothetical protein [Pajaroellobacter abortibovis]|uniref:Uncharacterized protein n=1 Tax=Pajaroellobacter abortibovis TaxID=1882918 RepID=A0A1L6MXZ1_9BACT|nr:hypothetical protein [Pajaroellobacter abortibovis]APS00346.1 hypothetical protein BCY86_06385 [Pajaroellobacter abortibovis]
MISAYEGDPKSAAAGGQGSWANAAGGGECRNAGGNDRAHGTKCGQEGGVYAGDGTTGNEKGRDVGGRSVRKIVGSPLERLLFGGGVGLGDSFDAFFS